MSSPTIPFPSSWDVIVFGAGAAGLMCAIEAGKRGRRVLVLDHSDAVGKKILISGGGRCNFTNLNCQPENFLSSNPHFCKSALARYTPQDFVALVEKYGIAYHEKTLGQLFCDRSARDILSMLNSECRQAQVQLQTGATVLQVSQVQAQREAEARGFAVTLALPGADHAVECRTQAVVVATGGLSIPKMGASGFGYSLAKQFGLKVQECRPALVPFTFDSRDQARWADLAGVAAEVEASLPATGNTRARSKVRPPRFREKMLITHRGLSGPAILQISSYWAPGSSVCLDLAPDRDVTADLRAHSAGRDWSAVRSALRQVLSNRLADRWLEQHGLLDWSNRGLEQWEQQLHTWSFTPQGTEGYEKAEVTAGGVSTDELSAQTMESHKVPGLFFIGEVVDVTGQLGGFNFQWAWASGFAAGQAL